MSWFAWTSKQIKELRELYSTAPFSSLEVALAPHTPGAIRCKANELGLTKRKRWADIARNHKPVIFSVNHRVPITQIESAENERANDR